MLSNRLSERLKSLSSIVRNRAILPLVQPHRGLRNKRSAFSLRIGSLFTISRAPQPLWLQTTEGHGMNAQTKLPPMPSANDETRTESRPPASPKATKVDGPIVYWGDRLTLKFWLFCFGLMLAMNLIEAIHRLVLFLMGRSPAP